MNRIHPNWLEERGDSNLDAAIEAILADPIDNRTVERVAQRASALQESSPISKGSHTTDHSNDVDLLRPHWMHRKGLRFVSLFAALAASLAFLFWIAIPSAPIAFATISDSIKAIRSARFQFTLDLGGQGSQQGSISIRDQMVRYDQGPLAHIFDSESKQAVVLDSARKLWQELDLSKIPPPVMNPIEELVAVRDKAVKSLGSEWRDGKKTNIYRLDELQFGGFRGQGNLMVWTDAESNLPVRIEFRDPDPKHKMAMVFDRFEWNPEINPELFARTVPPGFQVGEIVKQLEAQSPSAPIEEKQEMSSGILYSGRVPGWIAVDRERQLLTAILRDPEAGPSSRRPNELRQWDLSNGKILWTESVGGASQFGINTTQNILALVEGQEIQIREGTTGKVVRTMESRRLLGSVAIAPAGSRLAHGYTEWGTGGATPKGGVELWNTESGALERTIDIGDRVDMVAFSPDAKRFAAASSRSIRFYNADTGALEHSVLGTTRIAFAPSGEWVAFPSAESVREAKFGCVDLFNFQSMAIERSLTTQLGNGQSWLLGINFSPSGNRLAASDWNGAITVWDLSNGEPIPGLTNSKGGVHNVHFIDEDHIATGSEDGILQIHKLKQ